MRLPSWLALSWFVGCGALAGLLVAGLVPSGLRQPHLDGGEFRLARTADRPLEVSPSNWLFVPQRYGDFVLRMELELGEATDVDVVLRRVEPRLVDDQLLPFHGRFSVLRLSTRGDGPAWRTRDEALLAQRPGGVSLAPGLRASVWIEGHGRLLRANVAGKPLPWFTADDEYGMLTLIARGGPAVVHELRIEPRGQHRAWLWARGTWAVLGAIGALVVAAALGAAGAPRRALVVAGVAPPLLAWLVARQFELDLGWPPPPAMLCLLTSSLATAALWLRGRGLVLAALTYLAAGLGAHAMLQRDERLADELFGPRSGQQPCEALGQLVRGPGGLHAVDGPALRVMLLGGQLLYDRGQPAEHLELLLTRELRAVRRQPVAVPCLPTVDGHARQQWRLYTTCFQGHRPQVLVFGVGRDEAAIDEATGQPRSSPLLLEATLRAVREHVAAAGQRLVLFADAGVPGDLMRVLRAVEREGVPTVVAADGEAPAALARRLAQAVLPLLP